MQRFDLFLCLALKTSLTVACAELNAGMVHWFEDAYIREDTPLVGHMLGRPNVIHHHYPRHMTRNNWWQSSYDLVLICIGIVTVSWFAGILTWQVWLFAFLSANANEMHKWTHRTREENGPVITFLQDSPHPANPEAPPHPPQRPQEQPLLHHDELAESRARRNPLLARARMVAGPHSRPQAPPGHLSARLRPRPRLAARNSPPTPKHLTRPPLRVPQVRRHHRRTWGYSPLQLSQQPP